DPACAENGLCPRAHRSPMLVIGALAGTGRFRHTQGHGGEPFAVLPNHGQIIRLSFCAETMLTAHANRHRILAAAQAKRAAASPLLVQLPASRIGIAEARETFACLESRESRCL